MLDNLSKFPPCFQKDDTLEIGKSKLFNDDQVQFICDQRTILDSNQQIIYLLFIGCRSLAFLFSFSLWRCLSLTCNFSALIESEWIIPFKINGINLQSIWFSSSPKKNIRNRKRGWKSIIRTRRQWPSKKHMKKSKWTSYIIRMSAFHFCFHIGKGRATSNKTGRTHRGCRRKPCFYSISICVISNNIFSSRLPTQNSLLSLLNFLQIRRIKA